MGLPKYDEIHLPLLKLVLNNSVYSLKEAVELLAKKFRLTDEELNERVNSGGRKFYSQVSFSKMLLTRAGLIFKGIKPFKATDKARKIMAQYPKKITKRCLDELAKRKQVNKNQKEKDEARKLLLNSYSEYLQKLTKIDDPCFFEHVTGLVLSKFYNIENTGKVEITQSTNDKGIDGIIHLGKDEQSKVYFQSKLWQRSIVGEPVVHQFSGALDRVYGTKGYVVTTSRFSSNAVEYVKKLRYKEITLIDGHKSVELIFKYKLENEILPIKQCLGNQ